MDKSIERIKKHKEYPGFRERAEIIKQNVKNHGVAPTSILFCIGKKEE